MKPVPRVRIDHPNSSPKITLHIRTGTEMELRVSKQTRTKRERAKHPSFVERCKVSNGGKEHAEVESSLLMRTEAVEEHGGGDLT